MRINDNAKSTVKMERLKDYQCRLSACILLEEDRLKKKLKAKVPVGVSLEQYCQETAVHNVYKTLWILRNVVGLSRRQALEWLEDRQVQKRTKIKTVFFWELRTYNEQLEYDEQFINKITLSEAIKNYMLKSSNKRQPYLWLARQAKRIDMKPRELVELIDRLKYRQSCDTTVSNDSSITTCDIARNKKVLQINLVEQLEQYYKQYVNKRIIVYGNMLFTTINYTQLYNMIYCAYGKPNSKILANLYQEYCSGEIYYKEDIVQDYVNRIKNTHN